MPLLKLALSRIFFKRWFWWVIWLVLCIVIYFAKRKSPNPFPRVGEFLIRHKKGITKILDIFVISMVLIWFSLPLYGVRDVFEALSNPEPVRTTLLQSAWSFLFISLIIWSGWSGLFIGFLSVFQSNLTKARRIILLIVCLLPVAFTLLGVLMGMKTSLWITIQICLFSSILSWIVNVPAIIVGKHFICVFWSILHALHLVSGDFQE